MSDALNVLDTLVGCASFKRNTLSMTEISVDVELIPTNALQSFTTHPAANTSLPRFTVPACNPVTKIVDYYLIRVRTSHRLSNDSRLMELAAMTTTHLDLVWMFWGGRVHLDYSALCMSRQAHYWRRFDEILPHSAHHR